MTNNTNNKNDEAVQQSKKQKVLVVGATGNTGKHVVRFLLDQGHFVTVMARSKDKMYQVLPVGSMSPTELEKRLTVMEASVLDLTDQELKDATSDKDAIVSCLGHAGISAKPKRLVRDAVMRLTTVMPSTCKFSLMSASGVAHTDHDPKRHWLDRVVLYLVRNLVPPHADNEEAAEYLYQHRDSVKNWVVVRPTDLIDIDQVSDYDTHPSPIDRLFSGEYTASRINVAHFMANLSVNDKLFEQWNQKMPVFYDRKKKASDAAKE
jgi:putative NADH-flavin reductase